MNELNEFNININGNNHKATVIMNFELYDSDYCIYGVRDNNKNYNIYCGEIINNTVVPLKDKDKNITNKIVLSLTKTIKR